MQPRNGPVNGNHASVTWTIAVSGLGDAKRRTPMLRERLAVVAGSSGGTGASVDGGGSSCTPVGICMTIPGAIDTFSGEAVETLLPWPFSPAAMMTGFCPDRP